MGKVAWAWLGDDRSRRRSQRRSEVFSDPTHGRAPMAMPRCGFDTGRMTAALAALPAPTGFWPRLAWALWPPRCLVCAEPGLSGCDLCAACWAQWPRAERSCLGCAMPMVAASVDWGPMDLGPIEPAPMDPTRAVALPAIATPTAATPAVATPAPAISAIAKPMLSTPILALPAAANPTDSTRTEATPAAAATHDAEATSPTPTPPDRCGACRARASPLREVRAASLYRAPLDRLLPRFKFHHDLAAGRLLATTMAAAFAPLAGRGAATLIPVPLHRSRLRQRGYDQALELARPLSRRLGLPLRANGLHRARDTPPQSRLDAAQRRRNLRDAFAWTADAPPPTHAILIDDVMTTGATLHAAAQALQRAGAQRVDAWVCARTL
jgi:ComF family protein